MYLFLRSTTSLSENIFMGLLPSVHFSPSSNRWWMRYFLWLIYSVSLKTSQLLWEGRFLLWFWLPEVLCSGKINFQGSFSSVGFFVCLFLGVFLWIADFYFLWKGTFVIDLSHTVVKITRSVPTAFGVGKKIIPNSRRVSYLWAALKDTFVFLAELIAADVEAQKNLSP